MCEQRAIYVRVLSLLLDESGLIVCGWALAVDGNEVEMEGGD